MPPLCCALMPPSLPPLPSCTKLRREHYELMHSTRSDPTRQPRERQLCGIKSIIHMWTVIG